MAGYIENKNGYYPYGEPWREPAGQPYLFGGKERLRDNALNEYDFSARRLQSSLCLWTAPDPLATDYAPTSPYAYCAANPIKFTDPTGCKLMLTGDDVDAAMALIREGITGLSIEIEDGNVSYTITDADNLNENAQNLINIIDDKKITVNVTAQKSTSLPGNFWFCSGSISR